MIRVSVKSIPCKNYTFSPRDLCKLDYFHSKQLVGKITISLNFAEASEVIQSSFLHSAITQCNAGK